MDNKKKEASAQVKNMISKDELRFAIYETEHGLLTRLLGKNDSNNDKTEHQDVISNDELAASMSVIVLFADALLEKYSIVC